MMGLQRSARRLFLFAMLTVLGTSVSLGQASYSDAPLESVPVLDGAVWTQRSATVVDWLDLHATQVSTEQWPRIREDLYLLIGSYVQRSSRDQISFEEKREVLRPLFAWAAKTGVIGAGLLARTESSASPGYEYHGGGDFAVTLKGERLRIGATDNSWTATVPYYFMPWQLYRDASGRYVSDVFVTSTLHSANMAQDGTSQSTIMFVSSDQPLGSFTSGWLGQFGVTDSTPSPSLLAEGATRYEAVVENRQHLSALFWQHDGRSMAAIYIGLAGPYEANRTHFDDFVRALSY